MEHNDMDKLLSQNFNDLDDLPINSLFDANKLWTKIQTKKQQPKSVRVVYWWYAAAVLAGILIGLWPQQIGSERKISIAKLDKKTNSKTVMASKPILGKFIVLKSTKDQHTLNNNKQPTQQSQSVQKTVIGDLPHLAIVQNRQSSTIINKSAIINYTPDTLILAKRVAQSRKKWAVVNQNELGDSPQLLIFPKNPILRITFRQNEGEPLSLKEWLTKQRNQPTNSDQ